MKLQLIKDKKILGEYDIWSVRNSITFVDTVVIGTGTEVFKDVKIISSCVQLDVLQLTIEDK